MVASVQPAPTGERPTIHRSSEVFDDDPSCEAQCHTHHCGATELPRCCVVPMFGVPPHPADGFFERCLPGFWLDENSIESPKPPPIPVLNWVFDPENRILNDNRLMRIFGNTGTRWADAHRKELMGLALAMTVLSIPVAIMGVFGALSNNAWVVTRSNWAFAWVVVNETASSCHGMTAEIGLRMVVFETCAWKECRDSTWDQPMDDCVAETRNWDRAAADCDGDDGTLGIFDCATINGCHRSASGGDGGWGGWVGSQQQSAFVTCATLVFALMGCLTRIRWRQDTNFQKLIGCLPDTLSAVTGSLGLYGFVTDCYSHMGGGQTYGGRDVHFRLGVGYKAFWCCWAAQVGRAILHWVVPVPGGGGGVCNLDEPAHVKQLIAAHGLGETGSYRSAHLAGCAAATDAPSSPPRSVSLSPVPLASPAHVGGVGADPGRGMASVRAASSRANMAWQEPPSGELP